MDVPWIETAARHWRHGRIVGRRFADRRPGIRAALRAAAPDSVLLAGNSHAEFVGTPDLGGRACINIPSAAAPRPIAAAISRSCAFRPAARPRC